MSIFEGILFKRIFTAVSRMMKMEMKFFQTTI